MGGAEQGQILMMWNQNVTRTRVEDRGVAYCRAVVEDRELHFSAEGLREDGVHCFSYPLGRVVNRHYH